MSNFPKGHFLHTPEVPHIQFNEVEQAILDDHIHHRAGRIIRFWYKVREKFGTEEEFLSEMKRIREQIYGEGQYWGVYPDAEKVLLGGGIRESVFFNLATNLGYSTRTIQLELFALMLRRAMNADAELDLFIRSMLAGQLLCCQRTGWQGVCREGEDMRLCDTSREILEILQIDI